MDELCQRFRSGKWCDLYQSSGEYLGRTVWPRHCRCVCDEYVMAIHRADHQRHPDDQQGSEGMEGYLRGFSEDPPASATKWSWTSVSDASVANDANKSQGGCVIGFVDRKIVDGEWQI